MLSDLPIQERVQLAERCRGMRQQIAEKVTEAFLLRHPDWVTRYGDLARRRGIEDAIYHQDFLAATIESGEETAFVEYLKWTARVLESRGMARTFLYENVRQIADELQGRLSAPMGSNLAAFVGRALDASPRSAATRTAPEKIGKLRGVQELYLQTVLRGQRAAAAALAVESVRQGYSLLDVYTDVLQESMYEVGRLWESNKITVAQEHMFTAITQYVVARLYPLIQPVQPPKGRIVITGVEGEQHQVGPNIVADALESAGWDVQFLGVGTPADSVLKAVQEHQADILGISATLLVHIPHVRKLITHAVVARPQLRIILGGGAFRMAPELYKELGAAGVALDIHSALRLVETL